MDTFLQLNRIKLRGIFTRLSLISLGVVSIVLAVAYFNGNLPGGQLLLIIFLATGFGFPLLIMCLGYVVWLLNHKARQKAFSKHPFNEVEDIGFYKYYLNQTSKWAFTEECKEGKLNGFVLGMNLSKEKSYHFLEFDIPVEWKKLEKSQYEILTEKFKQQNAEFRIGSLVKQYDTREQKFQSVTDLKLDLELFTTLLRQERINPKT